ncbi:hypothetical protein Q8A73_019596 [Channa argus]|nr:hypothetical protein Q8A73_019596 [Channa argus]
MNGHHHTLLHMGAMSTGQCGSLSLPGSNSGSKSRDGQGGCNIRMIIAGAPMALHRAWNWAGPGKARSRCVGGREHSKGAAAAVFIRKPRRTQTARSESREISAPVLLDSDT